jgi:hypothetical protein
MSFGLRTSFGRYLKRVDFPPYVVIDDGDYFNVIHKDGTQSNEYETDEYIFGKDDQNYYMINKKALASVKKPSVTISTGKIS